MILEDLYQAGKQLSTCNDHEVLIHHSPRYETYSTGLKAQYNLYFEKLSQVDQEKAMKLKAKVIKIPEKCDSAKMLENNFAEVVDAVNHFVER